MKENRMFRGNVDKVMADSKEIARRLRETDVTLEQLQAEYHCAYPTIMRAIKLHIKSAEWKKIKHIRLARGGVKTQFIKGHAAWNKGKHYNPGGRTKETQFKPSHIRGQAARLYRPIGTITIRHDTLFRWQHKLRNGVKHKGKSRRWIKIKDCGRPKDRWIPYARYLYEKKYGPVPTGFFVVHKEGNQMNDAPNNLMLTDRRGNLTKNKQLNPERMAAGRTKGHKNRKKNTKIRRQMNKFHGLQITNWECCSCGADYRQKEKPQRCIKCGGGMFEKVILCEAV